MRASSRLQPRSVFASDIILARVSVADCWMTLSIFLCMLVTAFSQASSSAVMGGTVVVVGATVVLVVVAWDAAVDVPSSPAHPPASTTSRTMTTRRAAERRVLAGMRIPPPAPHAARVACHATCSDRRAGGKPVRGTGPQLQRPPSTTHPARPVGAVDPSRRGPQSSRRTLLPALLPVENATNADVVMAWSSELRELEQHASVRAGSARHREPLVLGGHQRSRSGSKNRRSRAFTATTSADEAARRRVRIPPPPPGGSLPQAGGPRQRGRWSPQTGFTLRPSWWPSLPGFNNVGLAGRAPDVPYASVDSGHPRTITVSPPAL